MGDCSFGEGVCLCGCEGGSMCTCVRESNNDGGSTGVAREFGQALFGER